MNIRQGEAEADNKYSANNSARHGRSIVEAQGLIPKWRINPTDAKWIFQPGKIFYTFNAAKKSGTREKKRPGAS